jgi:hypothetical protein
MKYPVQMASSGMMYIPSFINIGSAIQKLIRGIRIQTHRQQGDLISLLLFLQNKESRLKIRISLNQIPYFYCCETFAVWITSPF